MLLKNNLVPPKAPYPGSKNKYAETYLDMFPRECTIHVEPFAGLATTAMVCRFETRIVNDLDLQIAHFLKVMSNKEIEWEALQLLAKMDFSKSTFDYATLISNHFLGVYADTFVAACTWATLLMSYNGKRASFKGDGIYEKQRYRNFLLKQHRNLGLMHGIQVNNRDALEIIQEWRDNPACAMLIDPPYYKVTGLYGKEFDRFAELSNLLIYAKAKVILCDYENPIYDNILLSSKRWRRIPLHQTVSNMTGVKLGSRKRQVTENIWCNF